MSDEAKTVEGLEKALAFEQEKVSVLLDEVIALEDDLVNRSLAEFADVVTDKTRDFWRGQLCANRAEAEAALKEMAEAKRAPAPARPLHNRGGVRQGAPDGQAGAGDDGLAAKIRNRAQEISKAEGVPFSKAFRQAEKELAPQG